MSARTPRASAQESDTDRWWRLVEQVAAHGTYDERRGRLQARLNALEDAAFRSFVAFYVDRLAAAERGSLWRAVRTGFGDCDTEFFGWVRAELIFRGRGEYERALAGDSAFTEYGGRPTADAGAAVFAEWRDRFPTDPLPAPRVGAPPDDTLESASEGAGEEDEEAEQEEYEEEAPPSRIIAPPRGLPSFCLDVNPEVPQFTGVRVNGRGCSRRRDRSPEPPPPPSVPVPRVTLCQVLTDRAVVFDPSEDGESVPCECRHALPNDFAIYVVGPPSFEVIFLVQLVGDMADIITELGMYSAGTGVRYESVRGHHLEGEADAFTFLWREETVDWDLGFEEFMAAETCMAIRCEREGAGHQCSVQRALRSYGGTYGVGPMDEERNWPEVGAPTRQWDCRPGRR